jgi:hypothetical protein
VIVDEVRLCLPCLSRSFYIASILVAFSTASSFVAFYFVASLVAPFASPVAFASYSICFSCCPLHSLPPFPFVLSRCLFSCCLVLYSLCLSCTHIHAQVHERDSLSDFLLIILRDLLIRRPTLKVCMCVVRAYVVSRDLLIRRPTLKVCMCVVRAYVVSRTTNAATIP